MLVQWETALHFFPCYALALEISQWRKLISLSWYSLYSCQLMNGTLDTSEGKHQLIFFKNKKYEKISPANCNLSWEDIQLRNVLRNTGILPLHPAFISRWYLGHTIISHVSRSFAWWPAEAVPCRSHSASPKQDHKAVNMSSLERSYISNMKLLHFYSDTFHEKQLNNTPIIFHQLRPILMNCTDLQNPSLWRCAALSRSLNKNKKKNQPKSTRAFGHNFCFFYFLVSLRSCLATE